MFVTLPNWVTLARLAMTAAMIVCMARIDIRRPDETRPEAIAALVLFLLAAVSDAADGWLARKLNQFSAFGRVMDPLADKLLICGAFISLAGPNFHDGRQPIAGITPWMAVVVLARELLVTAIRSHSEASKVAFGAGWTGKLKMVLQCIAVGATLAYVSFGGAWLAERLSLLAWLAVAATILSALGYLGQFRAFLLDNGAMSSAPAGRAAS